MCSVAQTAPSSSSFTRLPFMKASPFTPLATRLPTFMCNGKFTRCAGFRMEFHQVSADWQSGGVQKVHPPLGSPRRLPAADIFVIAAVSPTVVVVIIVVIIFQLETVVKSLHTAH